MLAGRTRILGSWLSGGVCWGGRVKLGAGGRGLSRGMRGMVVRRGEGTHVPAMVEGAL